MAAVIYDGHPDMPSFARWEQPIFGEVVPEPPEEPVEAAPMPTVADLEALEEQAREEGFAAGRAEGLAAGKQQIDERLAQLDALFHAAARPLQSLDESTEQELAQLAVVMARQVLAHELSVSPERVLSALRQATRALPSAARELRVFLHPADLALLRQLDAAEAHWQLQGDPSLARGDCVLQSERSRLDARVQTRLASVIDAVLGEELAAEMSAAAEAATQDDQVETTT